MDTKYLEYCYADPKFYDLPVARLGGATAVRAYRVDDARDWSGWQREVQGGWLHVMPREAQLPRQGWKIHCSATAANAQHLLTEVSAYCHEHGVPFKHLPTSVDLVRSNVKYAARGGSGKFITVYPRDDAQCRRVLEDLDARIGGADGPYVLSDLRWNAGPLYVRYGGFALDLVRSASDELVPAILAPDGTLVPDERTPVFRPPAWVELPDFVREQIARLGSAERPDSFPYEVTEALHFSNGGGIYKARSLADGDTVVLKEARPHAGLSPDGRDAVQRLEREVDLLRRFADVPAVVRFRDHLVESGHHFLVEELVEGRTLNKEMVMRTPLVRGDQTRADRLAYRDWVLDVVEQVERTVALFHERGVVYGDLHPNNLIVAPDGAVRFIDFEMAYGVDETDVAAAGAPGYMPPDGRTGVRADLYSLACLRLGLLLPLTVLLPLDERKLEHLVARVQETFELDDEYCARILRDAAVDAPGRGVSRRAQRTREVVHRWDTSQAGLAVISEQISRGVWENLDLSRRDRAFPGDIRQFTENGLGLAHGACGVLLAAPGAAQAQDDVLDWVLDGLEGPTPVPPGFYDGLAGIAYTARRLGRDDVADRLVAQVADVRLELLTSDLYGGLAGIGCFLLEEAQHGDAVAVRPALDRIRTELAARLERPAAHIRDVDGVPTVETGRGGLLWGLTGQALFWLRSHEVLGGREDLDRAVRALEQDLALCVPCADDSLQLNEGWRTLPYVASGSTGVGLVLLRALEHVERPGWAEALAGIERAVRPDFVVQSNLLNGRAGFVTFLGRLLDAGRASARAADDLARHVDQLGTYAVVHRTGVHFPGEQVMRLSTDWGSGSAGVKDVLDAYARRLAGASWSSAVPLLGLDPLYPAAQDVSAAA
ncbi:MULTISPECIES: class III lanthionine synthetase LanKC [Cellulomonas]|uniref:class III lanthionine synthetase LanKC n=1 Tax=Cellulomonas TaxID=1707 RepID=UPI0010A78862|nr:MULTISPECIES: class III lanthionine synthetase LanKC [Cellulomonas]